ncbi:chaplin family protein [Nocardiopsis sp. NPDC006938]|uniref:chaplin family protein n=1 Tax=Nocardiopsis sp. NPDC006938 TaxID=3364337 RepID=UPI0036D0E478
MRNTFRYSFATALTAGLVLAPFGAAFADAQTDGSGGIASGNQVVVPVDVEANLCGNSLAVLGISKATCTKVSEVLYESSGQGASTDGSGGVASGNQIVVPVDAAVDACGNSVAVAGISEAECVEVVEVLEKESEDAPSTMSTDGSGGVASGNQITVPVDTAIEICGNSVAVLGASSAQCTTIINIIHASPDNEGAPAGPATSGAGGVASGNQVTVPVNAAVGICGNAVSVLGIAEASCVQTISEKPQEPEEKPEESEKPKDPEKKPEESEKPKDPERNEETEKPEEPGKKPEETDDKPAPKQEAGEELAVTGSALGGLVAAAVAAIGAGGAGLYFARKRRAAAATDDE